MNFLLSEQQLEIQDTVRRVALEHGASRRLHQAFDGDMACDEEFWRALVDIGVSGLQVPDEYGGAGLEMIDLAIVAQELGSAASAVPFLGHALATYAILLAGNEVQRSRWLPKLASGEVLGTVAFAEGENIWQPEQWQFAGGDTLSGSKQFVTGASLAGLCVVGLSGGGLVLVELDAPGISFSPVDSADRTRRLSRLTFDKTPAEVLASGAQVAPRIRDAGLVLLAADAFGGASRCIELAMQYAKERHQFGVPIGRFQALKHQLVNMAVDVEPARGLYWFAAHAFDHIEGQAPRAAAIAKAHLADRFIQVARDTVEAHGGVGYTWDYDVQIYLKRALFDYAYLGVPSGHRQRGATLSGW